MAAKNFDRTVRLLNDLIAFAILAAVAVLLWGFSKVVGR